MPYGTVVSATKDTVTTIKEVATALREVLIVVALVVAIANPAALARWVKGIADSMSAEGAKSTQVNLGAMSVTFERAAQQVADLQAASKTAQEIAAAAPNTQQGAALKDQAEKIESSLQESIASLKTTALANDQVRQKAPELSSGAGTYGIVVSADKGEDPAAYEVQLLRRRNMTDVAIYARQGFLRTVVRFADKAAAERELDGLTRYRSSAYLINLDKWCPGGVPSPRRIGGAPVVECR